jgi:hypothetical protein
MAKRRLKEPEPKPGSVFADVIKKGRTMRDGLSSALPVDEDARNMILAKIEGMESILLLCQRASAGESIDVPRLVKVERGAPDAGPGVLRRIADLERHVAELEVFARGGAKPTLRAVPAILETPKVRAELGKCERALLDVLAQRKERASTTAQLSVLSGYSLTSSGFSNALGRLRTLGLARGGASDVRITEAGLRHVPIPDPMPTGRALLALWCAKLGKAEATLLRVLFKEAPKTFDAEELSQYSGYSRTSSGFTNAIGKLRGLQLATRGWPTSITDVFTE